MLGIPTTRLRHHFHVVLSFKGLAARSQYPILDYNSTQGLLKPPGLL